MKLAAIYTRVSSDQQKEAQTIESQVSSLQEYAKKELYQVPPEWVFRDEGYSGSILERPGLDRIRDLAAEQQLDTVLIYSPDRLSRTYVHQMLLVEELNAQGVEVVFFNSPKSDSPESVLLLQFQGMIAEYERALIRERSRRGKRHKAKQGVVSVLSGAPYGYRYIKKTELASAYYEVIEDQSRVVRDIYRLFTEEGLAIGKICKWLGEQKILTKTGLKRWDRSVVWAILRNPAYMGKAYFGKTRSVARKKVTKKLRNKGGYSTRDSANEAVPKSEWIAIPVPAIIEEATFELAQEQLIKNKELAARRTKVPTLLQGIMFCKHCTHSYSRISSRTSKRKIYYYKCIGSDNYRFENGRKCDSRPIRQDYLDEVVWEHVIQLLKNPVLIDQEVNKRLKHATTADPLNKRKKLLDKEHHKIQKSIDKILDAYQEHLLPLDELRKRMPDLRKRQATVEQELKSLEAKVLFTEKDHTVIHNMKTFLQQLHTNANNLSIEERQRVLRLIVKDIEVSNDSIKINHCLKLKGRTEGTKSKSYLLRGGSNFAFTVEYLFAPSRPNRN